MREEDQAKIDYVLAKMSPEDRVIVQAAVKNLADQIVDAMVEEFVGKCADARERAKRMILYGGK